MPHQAANRARRRGRTRRRWPVSTAAALLVLAACPWSAALAQDRDVFIGSTAQLFTNLTLIDGRGGPPQPNSSILVWNGRVRAAGPRSAMDVPQGTQIVDLESAFVVPGYIDAHAAPRDSAVLASMLAAGITGVREAAMPLARFDAVGRDALGDGPLPTVFVGGPFLEGPGGTAGVRAGAEDEIEAVVTRLVDERGAEFVSVAPSLPAAWVLDVARAARGLDASVWLEPRTDGWVLAIRSGADVASGIVSLDPDLVAEAEREGLAVAAGGSPALAAWLAALDPESAGVERVISALLSRDAALAPLLAATERTFRCGEDAAACGPWSAAERGEIARQWPAALALTRRIHGENVRLLVGSGTPTDAGAADRFHREMEILVEAGMSELEVLEMATRNAAIALGVSHRRGTIEADRQADFLILGDDPTADIRHARAVRLVVLDGETWRPLPEGGFERIRF